MRRTLIWLLCISVASQATSIPSALGEDDRTKELEEINRAVHDSYPYLLKQSFLRQIDGYLAKRGIDILMTSSLLYQRAKAVDGDLNVLEESFFPGIDHAAAWGESAESLAVRTKLLSIRLRSFAGEAKGIEADLALLENTWNERCSEPTLAFADHYFTPNTKHRPDAFDLAPKAGEYTMMVQYSAGRDGNGLTAGTSFGPGNIAGTVTSATIATFRPELYTLGLGIGAAVSVAITVVLAIFENKKYEREKALVEDTRNFQETTLAAESASAKLTIRQRCATMLGDDGFAVRIAGYRSAVGRIRARADADTERSEAMVSRLEQEARVSYAAAAETAFSRLRNDYLKRVESRLSTELDLDRKAEAFAGKLDLLISQPLASGAISRADLLWDELITGDFRFNRGSEFSFAVPGGARNLNTFWEKYVATLSRELVRE